MYSRLPPNQTKMQLLKVLHTKKVVLCSYSTPLDYPRTTSTIQPLLPIQSNGIWNANLWMTPTMFAVWSPKNCLGLPIKVSRGHWRDFILLAHFPALELFQT